MSFYNTTNETGEELKSSTQKAETQTEKVLTFFKKYPSGHFTPFDVHRMAFINGPITSVRRCISDLTKEGKLIKTTEKLRGDYGAKNYLWRLNQEPGQQISLEL